MKKSILKKMIILLCMILGFSVLSFAGSIEDFDGTINSSATSSKNAVVEIISVVLNVTRTVGIAVAVIILIVVACKYIIASAGDKADIKKYATSYIIGALVLFGASGLVSLAKSFVDSSLGEGGESA